MAALEQSVTANAAVLFAHLATLPYCITLWASLPALSQCRHTVFRKSPVMRALEQ